MAVWLNGEIFSDDEAKLSVFDHATLYGDGVFEGIRVYHGRVFQGPAHLDRLYASAAAVRLKIERTREELTEAMVQTVDTSGLTEGYIRLVVTRGNGTLGLDPFKCPQPNIFIIVSTIAMYSREMIEQGMSVIIARTRRTSAHMLPPHVKCNNYLNNILAKIEAVDAGAAEAIMLNEAGEVAEASGDNVFVVRDGQLQTPPSEAGCLLGITRGVILKLAERAGIPAAETTLRAEDLHAANECFLTGTGAEIVPVTTVNGLSIGDGRIGPITRKLTDAFHSFVRTGEELPYIGPKT